ncbi:maltoporin [Photobacterium rosenbergii]|uniref:Maltoporin n=1 Tax=Photobacterium rosenbergii TaxID=294936 RepID=A0A2T3NLR4_9GAMM|nr:carbohydrate porin [Photobacterium rosenbergii]PSW16464.1 maltoporin [Photobacterium rosenbergii]
MKHKLVPVAAALLTALASHNVAAESATDIVTDGWTVNGYASMNYRLVEGETTDNEYGKPDYMTAGTHGHSTNQVEFIIKKHTEHRNGVWSDFVVRSEYGNGNTFAYSSPGSQKQDHFDGQFEIKETYVEIGGISFLGEDTSVWGGQRFLNRSAGLLSGEFWKQSSGVGAGIQTKLGGNTAGFAVVSADADGTIGQYQKDEDGNFIDSDGNITNDDSKRVPVERKTLTSIDLYYYGVQALGGSFDFDLKFMSQANSDDDGIGASITYNRDYYGLDGWTQTAIAYGKGIAQNRGVNFGSWSGGDDNAESLFITSYGVLNISDNWQMGSEITYIGALDELWGAEDLERMLIAVRPSYKVNDNLRLEMTASYGYENGKDGYWGREGDAVKSEIYNFELAAPLTVNADYFGRPQIKPYVSHIMADDRASAERVGIRSGDSETIVGVHTEIWF